MADGTSSNSEHPAGDFSVGAGYERYKSEWGGSHSVKREVFQNRIYVQGDYHLARRFRAGARLGAADLSAPDLDDIEPRNHIDYGFSPFGSINLNWTPIGALPGTRGAALEILFEASAFAAYTASKIEGSLDGFQMTTHYEAWPELSGMWEGKLAVLLAAHNGSSRFGAGLMLLQSGAETRTRLRTSWSEGVWNKHTLTNYFKTQNEVGMLYTWRFSPGLATLLNTKVVLAFPAVQFNVSLSRILTR